MVAVRETTETVGLLQMGQAWGLHMFGALYVDSSAALMVVGRRRNGRLRHVRVGHLRFQERPQRGEVSYRKQSIWPQRGFVP